MNDVHHDRLHDFESAIFYCEKNGLNVTKPREEVLKAILGSKKPLGAYDILEKLAEPLNKPKPPTVYRAIDFWQSHGFIHRIESLNAYIGCDTDHHHEGSQFIICDKCGNVEEVHLCSVPAELQKKSEESGLKISHWVLELHGTCKTCQ